jgi:hypothetical protein
MPRWFLSYNSQDLGLMQSLEAALRRKDPDAHIYFAPKSIKAGTFWLPSIANEIAEATVFVLLVGEKGVGPWQVLEYNEALSRRAKEPAFPLVPVVLDGQPAPGLPFLRQLHWIVTADPASENSLALLMDAAAGGGAPPGEFWRHTAPYRGLAAMTEADTDYFFGRGRETIEVLNALAATPDKLSVLIGNSGVGKSSLAQAGAIAALIRQSWPETAEAPGHWPPAFNASRRWCFLKLTPGAEPLRALVESFLDTWQFGSADPERVKHQNGWIKLLNDGEGTLRDLLNATERQYKELALPSPPAFMLYVDQGEELYVRAEEGQRRRFSEILARGVADPRLYALMSLRADFFGELQKDAPLYKQHRHINVPPLGEGELLSVVTQPAKLLSVSFETDHLAADITKRTAEESTKDAGALPLLSYLLDDMWRLMVERGDGLLRLPAQSIELGRVLVDRANAFIARHPDSEELLRRIFTLKLATVREDGEPTRRRAPRSEFTDKEWRLVSELADHPNRLLVTATSVASETYAEVAHETIFRRWEKLRDWIAAEREFLAWKTGLESARLIWEKTPDSSKNSALLLGFGLAQALRWRAKRPDDIAQTDQDFISLSRKMMQRRRLQFGALVGLLALSIIAGGLGWQYQNDLSRMIFWFTSVRPYVLTATAERALKPTDIFRECSNCPDLVIIPSGVFMMGSAHYTSFSDEEPAHYVAIRSPFAVSKYEVSFDEWDACASYGSCPRVGDNGWGRGAHPVINVSWEDAKAYVAWLTKITGKEYRLLSEAEWEYAARAGSEGAFFLETRTQL